MLMVKKVEKPLTPKVLKDVYLFVSQLKQLISIFPYYCKRGFFDRKDLGIGNFGNYFVMFLRCIVSDTI